MITKTLSFAVLLLAACGGRAPDATGPISPGQPPPDTSTGAREGETCGGAAIAPGKPVTCASGLVCRNEAGDPTFPGKCIKG